MEYRSTLKAFNFTVLLSWVLFSTFLLSLPWLANFINVAFHAFGSDYTIESRANHSAWAPGRLRQRRTIYHEEGLCDTPAHEITCSDGKNFTALALKFRGTPYGCACGQGILGEGLCPMTAYGYSLNTYVSTAPALGTLMGFGAFPLMGTWKHAEIINKQASPGEKLAQLHWGSLLLFQISYTLWGVFPGCTFPVAHSILHFLFLATCILHWCVKAFICWRHWGVWFAQAQILFILSIVCIASMSLASILLLFAELNARMGSHISGARAYGVFVFEVIGLCISFGSYPITLLSVSHGPGSEEFQLVDVNALTAAACRPSVSKHVPHYRRGDDPQERRACRACYFW